MTSKRARTSLDSSVVNVWNRELGQLSTRNFAHRLAASEDLVLRLDILHKLNKHRGCVNTVSFSEAGDILVSGSDDRRIILWDWETGNVNLSFDSGHQNNVFQAKIMPYTEDHSIVSCAADGQVRHAQLLGNGKVETKLVAKHQRRAHKLAVEPGSPHIFYTCGEDGLVQHIDLRTGTATALFTCKPVQDESYPLMVRLNTIAVDPRNPNLFAVGGSDPFARLYDIRKHKWDGSSEFDRPVNFFCPSHLIDNDTVAITGLAFSEHSELLVSYSDEFIYLFYRDDGLGPDPNFGIQNSDGDDAVNKVPDTSSGSYPANVDAGIQSDPQAYKGHMNCETVKGVSFFGPKCEYVVSGSDCGRVFIWKKKGGGLIRVIEADKHVVNCIESHPHVPVLASSGIEHDIKIWTPKATDRAILPTNIQKDSVPWMMYPPFFLHGAYALVDFEEDDDEAEDDDEDDDENEDEDEGEDWCTDYNGDVDVDSGNEGSVTGRNGDNGTDNEVLNEDNEVLNEDNVGEEDGVVDFSSDKYSDADDDFNDYYVEDDR